MQVLRLRLCATPLRMTIPVWGDGGACSGAGVEVEGFVVEADEVEGAGRFGGGAEAGSGVVCFGVG